MVLTSTVIIGVANGVKYSLECQAHFHASTLPIADVYSEPVPIGIKQAVGVEQAGDTR